MFSMDRTVDDIGMCDFFLAGSVPRVLWWLCQT